MGAGQSSADAGGAKADVEVKSSYYDLLGLQRQATEDEIKKAYRKKALELHPDRNYGSEELATRTFAEVQAAYQVLSDPQERAWYDSHESAILRGDNAGGDEETATYSNIRMTSADDLARLVRKFNSSVDFTDAPSGFFGYLREQFESLAREEDAAGQWENIEAPEYPTFGHKDDTHDDVVKRFYAAWANFSTVKTFSWKDQYRLSEAPDRRIRRLMEKENNALRQEGIREFNEAVRALVAFVRKRDPRYTPSTQSEEERQKVLRDAAMAQAARARAANEAKMAAEVPEWTKVREPDELEESEEEEVVEQVIECVACNKTFKSERQFEAHEKSKKHQKAVQAVQRQMRKDNANLDLTTSGVDTPDLDEDDYEIIDDGLEASPNTVGDANGHHDEGAHSDVKPDEVDATPADEVTSEPLATNGHKIVEAAVLEASPARGDASSDSDNDYASPEVIRARLEGMQISTADPSEDDTPSGRIKLGKAAQKRAKKAAAAAGVTEEASKAHQCAGCNASFPSRTQLFQHIKDFGHAALKTDGSANGGKGKKGKAKR
ncbi:hypothetical protein B0A48_03045 [Cryoendolithus antarcticus]|uniref:J domain-containing protein n=1 Tax=Cryoendolithus antarcticus TaxID=1507870 RepID=A0A1V8TLY8_9PEZI|nr:hypothetical protein B0A48_03045 [Cryoendolithus antarcticus]